MISLLFNPSAPRFDDGRDHAHLVEIPPHRVEALA
jgi:hypothetical protein